MANDRTMDEKYVELFENYAPSLPPLTSIPFTRSLFRFSRDKTEE